MFSPSISQDELKKRSTDVEDLQQRHIDYVKKTNVRIQILENENEIRKGSINSLIDENKNLVAEHEKTKSFVSSLLVQTENLNARLSDLSGCFNDAINQKLDLANKIASAKKRLDASKKS